MVKRVAVAVLLLAVVGVAGCGGDEPAPPAVEVPEWAHVAPEQIAEAKKHGVPVAFENDLGMRFVLIPAGEYMRGLDEGDPPRIHRGRNFDTRHSVVITTPFYTQITEVTNAQYASFLRQSGRSAPASEDKPGDHPAGGRAWSDAAKFAAWLAQRDAARDYRLPTDAEWEYACRAGTTTRWWWGDAPAAGRRYANLRALDQAAESGKEPARVVMRPVATFKPNPWGLYDMIGNAAEWVSDLYGPYPTHAVEDPKGPLPGSDEAYMGKRILRGSHGNMPLLFAGTGVRDAAPSSYTTKPGTADMGFRLVSPLPEPPGGE